MPELSAWPLCDNKCIMCTNPDSLRRADLSFYSLLKLRESINSPELRFCGEIKPCGEHDYYFSGGEPLLNKNLLQIMRWVCRSRRLPRITLLTNGRGFASRAFAADFFSCLPDLCVSVSLCSAKPEIHDRITGVKGSCRQTASGILNAAACKTAGQILEIRIVLTRINLHDVADTLNWINCNVGSADRVVLVYPLYKGLARKNLKKIAISYDDCLPVLKTITDSGLCDGRLYFYHFPFCKLPRQARANAVKSLPDKELVSVKNCKGCRLQGKCPGIHSTALLSNSAGDFVPLADI